MDTRLLTDDIIQIAEKLLKRGERVELVPLKDGAKAYRIRREEAK